MSLWSQHSNQPINKEPCFTVLCLKTPYLVSIVDSLTLISRPTDQYLVSEGSLSNTHAFSIRHILCLGHQTALQHHYWGYFKWQITNKKYKNANNMGLNRSRKGHLFTVRVGTLGRVSFCSGSAGNVCMCALGNSKFSLLWACLWMTMKVPWELILGLKIHFR